MTNPEAITNSIRQEFIQIPAGTFLMGSPKDEKGRFDNETQHDVTISRSFYLGRTVVTQGQWRKVMGNKPWKGNGVEEGDDYPAVLVSWFDAVEFTRKLSAADGTAYRLPTEAEWEYACRGGTKTAFSFGDVAVKLNKFAWFAGNTLAASEKGAHQVAQKYPNPLGLYDMHGNVWEWCSDWYGAYPSGSLRDPKGPSTGFSRVVRGGQWGVGADFVRCAIRNHYPPDAQYNCLGFRLAAD